MNIPSIIDIEASGLGRGTYPIEVGFVSGDGQVGCTLVKPLAHWNLWSKEAESLHGITRGEIEDYGKDVVWVANWLNTAFKGGIVYSDGWANDMSWLGRLFDEAGIPQLFKIESLLTLLSDQERERWSLVYDETIASANLTRHRASSDAKMIQDTYKKIKNI